MTSFFIKYKNFFVILTVVIFIGSLGFVGAGVFMEEYGPNAVIAKVGDVKIKYKDYMNAVGLVEKQARSSNQEITQDTAKKIRQEVLQGLINQESLSKAADKFGIGVADSEIGYEIKNSGMFGQGGAFNKKAYVWAVRNNFGMNPEQYEQTLKKEKLAQKFQNLIILSAKVTPQELEMLRGAQNQATAAAAAKPEDKNAQDTFALAATQLKAQTLMNKFTEQFTAENRVEVFSKVQQQAEATAQDEE
jgi:hypothetical protein